MQCDIAKVIMGVCLCCYLNEPFWVVDLSFFIGFFDVAFEL
jgi:hypothetical protein